MPYRRRYRRGRMNRRRRFAKRKIPQAWYQKKYSAGELATKAYSGLMYLKGLVNSEKHMRDVDWTTNLTTTPMTSVNITAIPQGDGFNERTGNGLLCKYHVIRLTLNRNPSAVHAIDTVRIVVVRDTQQIGDTIPSYTDVYQGSSYQAHLSQTVRGRFDILSDKTYNIYADKPVVVTKYYIRNNKHVRFNGTLGTDIEKGGVYVMAVGSVAANGPQALFNVRTAWYDN